MALAFAHGFNIHFGQIAPPRTRLIMIAPKGPGHTVRSQYLEGKGVPDLIAVQQDYTGNAKGLALCYAAGIGGARAASWRPLSREETETDLFGEQAVLWRRRERAHEGRVRYAGRGGLSAGSAYFDVRARDEADHRSGVAGGLEFMRYSISDTAEYGDYTTASASSPTKPKKR